MLPYQTFRTKTRDLALAVGSEKLWQIFCPAIGRPELANDPRYRRNADRAKNRATLIPLLQEVFLTKTYEEWEAIFLPKGIPFGAINNIAQVVAHPQVQARGTLVEMQHPARGQGEDGGRSRCACPRRRARCGPVPHAGRAHGRGPARAARHESGGRGRVARAGRDRGPVTSFGIGAPVRRREDFRLLTGQGRYADDVNAPGQAYAAFVRSPHAHADVVAIDAAPALAVAGVLGVFTGRDLVADGVGTIPTLIAERGGGIRSRDGSPFAEPPWYPLATDRVRHVGEPVAIVVATTPAAAQDGADAVEVDYAVRPLVVDAVAALAEGAPRCTPASRATAVTTGNAGMPRPPRAPSPPPPTSRA